MSKSEASIANRVLLFIFVLVVGFTFWSIVASFVAGKTNIMLGLDVWKVLTVGTALLTDRVYVKLFPVAKDEKTSAKNT
jgi:hypothetical protein